jgi:hypothetical protein
MFSATRNSINMDAYLAKPTVVLVNGAEKSLGKEGMRIFLLFLVGQYYAAAKRRRAKHLAMCLVDEAWMVLQSTLIADILVELRGFNCSLVSMTQVWNQVAEEVRPAILGSTAIKAVGADASVFSREMFCSVEQIRSLKPYSALGSRAQWAMHLTGMPKAQVVSVPYGQLERMPVTNASPFSCIAETQRHYSQSPEEIPEPRAPAPETSAPIIIGLDANGRVDRALRMLTAPLQTLIERELKRAHPDTWQTRISYAQGAVPGQPLDPYGALKTMLDNWQSCFKEAFSNKARYDVSRALDGRNAVSHATTEIPKAEAVSYLVAIRDIATAIDAKEVSELINKFVDDQMESPTTTIAPTTSPPVVTTDDDHLRPVRE